MNSYLVGVFVSLKNAIAFNKFFFLLFLINFVANATIAYSQDGTQLLLLDFENKRSISNISLNDAKIKFAEEGRNHVLKATLGHRDNLPSIKFTLPETDLSKYIGIAMDIKNEGSNSIAIEAQCFNQNIRAVNIGDGAKFYYRSMIVLRPGESDSLLITFSRSPDSLPGYIKNYLTGMFAYPGGYVRRKENLDLIGINDQSVLISTINRNVIVPRRIFAGS